MGEALRQLFGTMPDDIGFAFIVVLHLSPTHESQLVEILQRATRLDVVPCTAGAELRPNCIYVIPPALMVRISGSQLAVSESASEFERRHPVDSLFQSLAAERGASRSASCSRAAARTARPARRPFASSMASCSCRSRRAPKHPEMPRNVIVTGLADRVLAPADMPAVPAGMARMPHRLESAAGKEAPRASDGPAFGEILSLLRVRGRHDFVPYKTNTIIRRISRRMGLNQIQSLEDYARKLDEAPEEVEALVADLLINVTSFFRDAEASKVT
jgi:two-component system, chemotaxis family, CheB/CheR fusion protein